MSAHTTGPWQVSHWYSDAGRSCGISNGILGVAAVYGIGRAESEANARLIAAAPELLAALIEATEQYALLLESKLEKRHARLVDQSPVLMTSRAAIAKATGSAS